MNFYQDPEAAYIVLKEMTNITLLPYEVCLRHSLSGVSLYFFYYHLTLSYFVEEYQFQSLCVLVFFCLFNNRSLL